MHRHMDGEMARSSLQQHAFPKLYSTQGIRCSGKIFLPMSSPYTVKCTVIPTLIPGWRPGGALGVGEASVTRGWSLGSCPGLVSH